MAPDLEIEDLLRRQKRARTRMLAAGLALGCVAVAAFFALRPTACEQVANRVCPLVSDSECNSFRTATKLVSEEKCVQALAGLDLADAMPEMLRTSAMTNVVTDLIVPPERREELIKEQAARREQWVRALRLIGGVLEQLDRSDALSEDERKVLMTAPPEACLVLVGRLERGSSFARQTVHEVLVSINDGRDLGARTENWSEWCEARARSGTTPPAGP